MQDRETLLKQRGPAALVLLLLSFFLVPSLAAHSPANAGAAVSATKAVKATPVANSLHEGRHDAAGPLDVPALSSGFPSLPQAPWTAVFPSRAESARAVVTSVPHQTRAPPAL